MCVIPYSRLTLDLQNSQNTQKRTLFIGGINGSTINFTLNTQASSCERGSPPSWYQPIARISAHAAR